MEIEIIEKQNQSLFVYKEGGLLFYSTVKFNWISRIIKIYNPYDVLALELKYGSFFQKSTYLILHQNKFMTKLISDIDSKILIFDNNKRLLTKSAHFFSLSHNFNYFFEGKIIAQVKQNIFSIQTKYLLNVNDENLELLDQIIFHLLSIKTGYSVD
ncbi:hypothetical protein [Flavobacterium tyrosinilyticum]|uniref:hypothetical protein n=1 Tax=Flavobacterium tyrosinilyticum TaxID=1658740 RepID=UPI00202DDFE6|nr:hypothetical protein [Flavobacterium tyrosinilyticum]MCM0667190.1 hypothetical protein [Flavobacterium tyrosinilyticum]